MTEEKMLELAREMTGEMRDEDFWDRCPICEGTGTHMGERCPDCEGTGWTEI